MSMCINSIIDPNSNSKEHNSSLYRTKSNKNLVDALTYSSVDKVKVIDSINELLEQNQGQNYNNSFDIEVSSGQRSVLKESTTNYEKNPNDVRVKGKGDICYE